MPEITELLERATPRDLPPPDVADLVRRGRRRRQRRRAALLATPVLAAGLVVAAPWDAPDRHETTITESGTDQLPVSITDDVDITLVLERTITEDQLDVLGEMLSGDPRVATVEYYDDEATLAEYRRIFQDNEAMLERIDENPRLVPSSFRIATTTPDDPATICTLADHLQPQPGVLQALTPERLAC